jgi:hypothetical protein
MDATNAALTVKSIFVMVFVLNVGETRRSLFAVPDSV